MRSPKRPRVAAAAACRAPSHSQHACVPSLRWRAATALKPRGALAPLFCFLVANGGARAKPLSALLLLKHILQCGGVGVALRCCAPTADELALRERRRRGSAW